MKKNCKSVLLLVSLLFLFFLFLFHSTKVVDEILSYTQLFYYHVFPTSFIFLLLSYLLIENHLLFYLQKYLPNKNLYFFLISIISGYPAGIIYVKDAFSQGEITLEEANHFVQFSHFPNPIFVLFQCQQLFSNKLLPFLFYGIILIGNYMIYLFTPKYYFGDVRKPISTSSFQKALIQTFRTLLLIYGTSVFFYLISAFITHYVTFSSTLYVFVCGIFDLTNGIQSSYLLPNLFLQLIFLYFFIIFGSIPIHLQIKSILSDTPISYLSFVKGRMISFLWSIVYVLIASFI